MAIEQTITERAATSGKDMHVLRHPVDLGGFDYVPAIIPADTTLADLIGDSARHMGCAIEILRAATAELERTDPRLARILAGATTLFTQAEGLQEAIHDVIIGRNAAASDVPQDPV